MDLRSVLTTTGTTAIFVTHDQGEAFVVADRLAVMRSGGVRQIGSAREIWTQPADDWVAGFVGYSTVLDADAATRIGAAVPPAGAWLGLRPGALVLDRAGTLTAIVDLIAPSPEGLLLTVSIDGVGEVQAIGPADARTVAGSTVLPGDQVRLRLDPAGTTIVPAAVTAAGATAATGVTGVAPLQ